MLAKKPDDRPASAAVVRDKLSRMLVEARGESGEKDSASAPPPMPSFTAAPASGPPSAPPPLAAPPGAAPSPFAPPTDGADDERTIVGVGMAAQVRAAVARNQAPVLKPAPPSAAGAPPARRPQSSASPVEAPSAMPCGQPVPRPAARTTQGGTGAPMMNDMPTLRAPTLASQAPSLVPRPVSGSMPRPATGAHARPSAPPPSRQVQSTYLGPPEDEEFDLHPTQPEMKRDPGSIARRPQASRETVSPQLGTAPRRTWLWIAIPAGVVGLLAMGAAIWLVLQRS